MNVAATLVLAAVLHGPDYPKQSGLLNDFTGILDPAMRAKIQGSLEGLEKSKNFVLVVVIVKSLEGRTAEDYTVGLANAWGIGQKGKNNGVVFLISPSDKELRVENGYGAETTLTDIESKLLMEEKVVPLFKEGRISEGILAGTEALVAKLGGGAIAHTTTDPPPPTPKKAPPLWIVVVAIVIIILLMCFPGGRQFLLLLCQAMANSALDSKSGGSKGSSGSGGGKFGGGGATSKW